MRKLLFYYAALSLGAAAACTVHQDTAPSPSGPSTNAISLTVTATPDTLLQDGVSTSRIVVKMFDAGGQPISGQQVRLEMQVGGVTQDFGTLSARNVATATDGSASAIYTAPGGTSAGGVGTTVAIIGTRVSGDAANQGILNSVGAISQAYVRLTPVGTVTTPPSAGGGVAAPTANFTISPSAPGLNQTVFFNASQSTAAAGHLIVSYNWDFGDGTIGAGATPTHAYLRPGIFTVTLTVFDDAGGSGVKANTLTVAGTSSQIVADFTSSPTDPAPLQTIQFDSSPSIGSPGASISSWVWDFGDGSAACGTGLTACGFSDVKPQHFYNSAHTWVVRLTIVDSAGQSATVTHNVTTK